MTEPQRGAPSSRELEVREEDSAERRLGEDRAAQILERAAALDAKRSSEIEVTQLREAAAAAGISREAFDEALREHSGRVTSADSVGGGALRRAHVARYTDLLRDLLGDEAEVVVVEDRIEAQGDGLSVSVDPVSGGATAAIVAESSLKRKLIALMGSAAIPAFLGFLIALEDEELGLAWMLGVILTALLSSIGLAISHRREVKELKKRAEQTRRQLQRMLPPTGEG